VSAPRPFLLLCPISPPTFEPVLDISIGDALRAAVARWPTRLALVEGNLETGARRRWMFAELLADAEKVARALLQRFAPGEHVASPKDLL
jgi:fatty-acyl-CoA synthase